MFYRNVYIELSGKCNAKCKWCCTGIENWRHPLEMPSMKKNVMSLEMFKRIIEHLEDIHVADKNTLYGFYNWGEPFLNPQLIDILSYMYSRKLYYALSTNGSIPLKIDNNMPKDLFKYLYSTTFSFCGFSQASYNRIHSFSFEKIKDNVMNIISLVRNHGGTNFLMAYHVYQFNQGEEMENAQLFCRENGIVFSPVYAFINDFRRELAYLSGDMEYSALYDVSRDLVRFHVDGIVKSRPANYHCPEFERLVIDENGILLPCCGVIDEDLGNIIEMDAQEIERLRHNVQACKLCKSLGFDYLAHNLSAPTNSCQSKKLHEYVVRNCRRLHFVLYGCGHDGKYALEELKKRGFRFAYCIDKSLVGKQFYGIEVKTTTSLNPKTSHEYIIIASRKYAHEMIAELLNLGFKEQIDFCDYRDLLQVLEEE